MTGIRIDWAQLELAFENHAPNVHSVLDRATGAVLRLDAEPSETAPEGPDGAWNSGQFLLIDPVPSREQYRMMERFIETLPEGVLQDQLKDCIVGKGAFRRFKDAVSKYPEERKRWFTFRDVLLHLHIIEWLQHNHIELESMPDWNLELPLEPSEEARSGSPTGPTDGDATKQEGVEVRDYLQAWARAHGAEYQYLFGPAAFERLAADMSQEFTFFRRRAG